jgi:hypothetical protein
MNSRITLTSIIATDLIDIESQKPECETQIDLSIFDETQISEILNVALDIAAEYYVDALWNQPKRTDLICPLFDEEIKECVDNYSCCDENVSFANYGCWRKQFIKDAISYIHRHKAGHSGKK